MSFSNFKKEKQFCLLIHYTIKMLDKIIHFSINNKFIIGLFTLVLVIVGSYSLYTLPIDALPDITNNQVQIITSSPTLATQEVEQFITYPIEQSVKSIPDIVGTSFNKSFWFKCCNSSI